MPKVSLGDVDIYYESHGEGSAVFLVPGLGGVGSEWIPNLPAFSSRYRTIIHDHRGAGQSSRSMIKYSVEQMTVDLLRLMDHLGVERAHLVGHSTGGAIAQTLAITQPDRLASLVIYASWTKADTFFRRVFEARRTLLTAAGATAYVRAASIFLYPDWWVNANESLLEERERVAIERFPGVDIVASRIDAIVEFDRTLDLPKIKAPTMILCAKDDILTPPHFSKALARLIPDARLHVMDKGGHCANETVREEFDRQVLAFLAENA